MKKIIVLTAVVLMAPPFIGYYEHHEEITSLPVFFIKKKPALQVVFHRIFHPNFEKSLHELTVQERQHVIDYCKYRLGIETDLNTVKAFKACRDD